MNYRAVCRACGDPFDPDVGLPDWMLKGMGLTFIPPWLRVLCNWCIEHIPVDMDDDGVCIGPALSEHHLARFLADRLHHMANRVTQKLTLTRCDVLKRSCYEGASPYRCRSYAHYTLEDGHNVCATCRRTIEKNKRFVPFIDAVPTHFGREIPILIWAFSKEDFWRQLREQAPPSWLEP